MQPKQFPLTLTIPTPMHTVRLRGVQANRGPYALGPLSANLRTRISRVDIGVIDEACEALGMTRAEFTRWCAVEVAKVINDL